MLSGILVVCLKPGSINRIRPRTIRASNPGGGVFVWPGLGNDDVHRQGEKSNFNPRARTGSYKGLFQLSDYEFEKYGDGSIWDARDNARAAAHMFLVPAEKFRWALGHHQITPRDTWCISRVSKARLNTTHTPSASRGTKYVRPTRAF